MNDRLIIYIICGYIYILFMILCYVWNDGRVKRKRALKAKEYVNGIMNKHMEAVINNKAINDRDIAKLRKRIFKHGPCFEAFSDELLRLRQSSFQVEVVNKYLRLFEEIIIDNIKRAKKDGPMEYSNAIFLYGEYGMTNSRIDEMLFRDINSDSSYVRINIIKTISKMGNLLNFITALDVITMKNIDINRKVLMDSIISFSGDNRSLDSRLLEKFYTFDNNIQAAIMGNFRNNKFFLAKDLALELALDEEANRETRFEAIKYLGVCIVDEGVSVIEILLQHPSWEIKELAAKIAGKYYTNSIRILLCKTIMDEDWNVRYNSALTIMKMNDKEVIDIILESGDKFAIDILTYTVFNRDSIVEIEFDDLTFGRGKEELVW